MKNVYLRIASDADGKLSVVDQDGRAVFGVKSVSVSASVDDLTEIKMVVLSSHDLEKFPNGVAQ